MFQIICLCFLVKIAAAYDLQHSLSSNSLGLPSSDHKFNIDLIDVKCDKHLNGMAVTIEFVQPFNGVIYSRGHYSDPDCRYVPIGQNRNSFTFLVPLQGCGSIRACAVCDSVENVLIIQNDEDVQSQWDTARKVSCSRTGIEEEKRIFFKPFVIDMLDVVTVPTSSGGVDCWMDIQRGIYPKINPIGDVIKIGEELSVMVYLRDERNEYDVAVRNCYAYDSEEFDDKNTGKVQLSDVSGCSIKPKLFGSWQTTTQTGDSGATLLVHNLLRAFKFPDKSQVYLKCDIEICKGHCAQSNCNQQIEKIVDLNCRQNPFHPKCKNTITHSPIDEKGENVYHSTIASTIDLTTRLDQLCKAGSTNPLCRNQFVSVVTTENVKYVPSTNPSTLNKKECQPGSLEPECIRIPSLELKIIHSTSKPNVFETTFPTTFNLNEKIENTPTNVPPLKQRPISNVYQKETAPPYLSPGTIALSTLSPVPSKITIPSYKFSSSSIPTFRTNGKCYPGSQEPECVAYRETSPTFSPETTPSKISYTSPQPITIAKIYQKSTTGPPYLPPETATIPSVSSKITIPPYKLSSPIISTFQTKGKCYPGSQDPECIAYRETTPTFSTETTLGTIPTYKVSSSSIPTFQTKGKCYPGSQDPECIEYRGTSPTFSPETTPSKISYTTLQPITTAKIYQKSTTGPPYLPPETATIPSVSAKITIPPYKLSSPIISTFQTKGKCYPGSQDPECIAYRETTSTFSTETTPRTTPSYKVSSSSIPTFQTKGKCYPGSQDPECFAYRETSPTFSPETTPRTTPSYKVSSSSIPTFQTKGKCYPGSKDPECIAYRGTLPTFSPETTPRTTPTTPSIITYTTLQPITTAKIYLKSTTGPPYLPPETVSKANEKLCYPGSPDLQCLSLIIKTPSPPVVTINKKPTTVNQIKCYPDSTDPFCKLAFTTARTTPPTSPVTTKIVEYTTTQKILCALGSRDPLCNFSPATSPTLPPYSFETTTGRVTNTTAQKLVCAPGSLDPRCPKQTSTANIIEATSRTYQKSTTGPPYLPPNVVKTQKPCNPGSRDPKCNVEVIQTPVPTFISTKETLPPISFETTTRKIIPTTTQPKIIPKLVCLPESTDRRCSSQTVSTTIRPSVTTLKERCYPGSPDPFCNLIRTSSESPISTTERIIYTTLPSRNPTKLVCLPGSSDPRCSVITTTDRVDIEETTYGSYTRPTNGPTYSPPGTVKITNSPIISSTTSLPVSSIVIEKQCYPGSSDPLCKLITTTRTPSGIPTEYTTEKEIYTTIQPKTTQKSICFPGSLNPLCKSSPTTIRIPISYETSTAQQKLICLSDSLDPRCPNPTPTASPPPYLPPNKTQKCYPGSNNPACRPSIPPFRAPSSVATTITPTPPKITVARCYPGSNNSACKFTSNPFTVPSPTTPRPIPSIFPEKTVPPKVTNQPLIPFIPQNIKCVPGTQNLECQKLISSTYPTPQYISTTENILQKSTATKIPIVTKPMENSLCYPGSNLPGCESTATVPSFCFPGSTDKRCPQGPTKRPLGPPATYLPPLSNEIPKSRSKREISTEPEREIITLSISVKGYSI